MAKKSESEKPAPNIAFVGRGKNNFQPLRLINNGDATHQLPEDQSKPFFHEDAKTICRLFPTHYKKVEPKG
jgi:hypothetical protein